MSERKVRVAAAALVCDGHVLLGHRHPKRRWYPSCWDLVGGHIEDDETPLAGLQRECLEELGIAVGDAQLVSVAIIDPSIEMHIFTVTSWTGEPENLVPHEHDELRWFAEDDLPGLELAHPAYLSLLRRVVEQADRRPVPTPRTQLQTDLMGIRRSARPGS